MGVFDASGLGGPPGGNANYADFENWCGQAGPGAQDLGNTMIVW